LTLHLLYFANPMCSWCWGFQPVIHALAERGYPITVAMGSMGADRARPMREIDRAKVREHWQHVIERTGQPFDFGFFEREGFVYDTEPACRAIAVLRSRYPALALPFLGRLQERFYALGQDITDPYVLCEAAGEFGIAADRFDTAFRDPSTLAEIAAEWQQTAGLGVTGYPTLLALQPGRPEVVTIGWRPLDDVLASLDALQDPPATPPGKPPPSSS
jgi:putative protein-disulfide isomerase